MNRDESPRPGENATDYWLRLQAEKPPQRYGPRLLTVDTMTPTQRRQYDLRLENGWHCWDALEAVRNL